MRCCLSKFLIGLFCLDIGFLSSIGYADTSLAQPTEYDVKAAYLFQFLKFMQWPQEAFQDSLQPIVIGIVGDTPMAPVLEELIKERTIFSRPIVIRFFQEDEETFDCHVLFIGSVQKRFQVAILKKLRNADIFTIGEAEDFIDIGGMIGFVSFDNRLGFHVNLKAIKHAQLVISAKILRLATVVEQ